MEATGTSERQNVNMIRYILLLVVFSCTNARIHDLNLKEDSRKTITLSTFGFLTGGTLAVNVTLSDLPKNMRVNGTLFGFTLDKTQSPGLSGYMEDMQKNCILNDSNKGDKENDVESVYIRFDLDSKKVNFKRVGKGLQKLLISQVDQKTFQIARLLHRRNAHADLSKGYAVGLHRNVRDSPSSSRDATKPSDALPADNTAAGALTSIKTGTGTTSSGPVVTSTKAGQGSPAGADPSPSSSEETDSATSNETNKGSEVEGTVETLLNSVVVSPSDGGLYQAYFLVYIQRPEEEGLYNLYFHNCLAYVQDDAALGLLLKIVEDNNGNYLTAGEMPVPALYFTFCVLFFICGVAWFSVIRKSNEDVFKIHYLMLVVIFVKSLACLFHGVNMYFIQINGVHEEAWAVLWYIVYLTRGALMFVTVLLIGAGWAFIKHMLTDKEKKLFLIVIPLQVLDQVAWVIVEESEEGNQSYTTWNEIFILVDLLCCGAILFPVVWSIRHLQDASGTDGKAAINLQKLRLFRHFYILVVCYIYFTRIIVYLMKITLPFKLEWLTDLFTELAMMVFFIVTGIKFRPATDNPYLQVPLDSDDEEMEMEEVLTKTGNTENLVKVNQKTEGADNSRVKQRESSHEYD